MIRKETHQHEICIASHKKRDYRFVSPEVNLLPTQKHQTLIEMVKEGGTTIYMAAKELGIPYSTAKHIISKHTATMVSQNESHRELRKRGRKKLTLVIIKTEAEYPTPQ
jgi:molybdenum-dependent DNA-binding transcriptional regulator ModE